MMRLQTLRQAFFWQSLQTRITLVSFAVILAGLWSLSWYASSQARTGLEKVLSEQQRSGVSARANEIERALAERMDLLEKFSRLAAQALARDPTKLQPMMAERPALLNFFNAGFYVTDARGTAIASVPLDIERIGVNYGERDHVINALKDGKSTVGKPVLGKALRTPVFSLATPIRDAQGQVIGALVGVVDLSKPNFLDELLLSDQDARGSMTLIAQPWELIVLSTDKSRLLQGPVQSGMVPTLKVIPESTDTTVTLIDQSGEEVLVSSSHIGLANWLLVASLPTAEAFKPANILSRNLMLATLAATALATLLIAWLSRRQLAQVHAAHQVLTRQTVALSKFEPLPHSHNDEIGQLIDGFNAMLSEVSARELALNASEQNLRMVADSLREAQQIAHVGNWSLELKTNALHWSEEIFRILEIDPALSQADYAAFQNRLHPDDRKNANAAYARSVQDRKSYQIEHRLRMADGRVKWVQERCHTDVDASGNALRSVGTVQDVTERKLADAALAQSRDLLLTIVETIPMRVFWKDRDLFYLGCNTLFARDAGLQSPADLIGRDDHTMAWADQADLYRADDFAVMASGQAKLFYDEPQTTPEGNTIWLRTSKIPLKDAQGNVIGVLGVYEDITERKLAETQLRKLSLIAEQSPETIFITDLKGNIEYVNASFSEKTGYTRGEVMGKNPRLLHSGKNPADTYAAMWATLVAGNSWSGELINERKDGTLYIDWAVITPLRAPDGKVTHYVSIQEDITERKQNADELERYRQGLEALVEQRTTELSSARQQADAANRSKSEFLANMSHEIRTPMNGVIGMVDVLRTTPLNAQQARMLDTVQKSSMSLLAILNDILDFSKIEAGKLEVEQVPTPLQDVVDSVMQLMLNNASARNIALTWSIDPALPAWVQSDPTRLRQILLNLVGNAIKFAPANVGTVQVQVDAMTREDGSAGFKISIQDNGIGMGADLVARLFRPFTQADASTMRKYGGTGLGLSITQRLVQMMHGQISVQSSPGVGSEFTVELPLIEEEEPGSASRPAALDGAHTPDWQAANAGAAAGQERLILMAEDNETNRDVISEQLRQLGYAVEMAEDGVEALALWRSGRHALLLTDCHMPRMDGFELTESIRKAEPAGTRLPIIAITANAMQGEAQRCKDHGMDDYLSKPLRMDELARMLARWLPATALQPAVNAAAAQAAVAAAPESAVVWDPQALGRLVGNNTVLQKQLLTKFLNNIHNHRSALDTARTHGDLQGLTGVAHTLKSAARTVGAMALGELCQALESAGRAGDGPGCQQLAKDLPDAMAQATQEINQWLQT